MFPLLLLLLMVPVPFDEMDKITAKGSGRGGVRAI
jgi:hypothetical protein